MKAVKARYSGRCGVCRKGWGPGEEIKKTPAGWAHASCPPDPEKWLREYWSYLSESPVVKHGLQKNEAPEAILEALDLEGPVQELVRMHIAAMPFSSGEEWAERERRREELRKEFAEISRKIAFKILRELC